MRRVRRFATALLVLVCAWIAWPTPIPLEAASAVRPARPEVRRSVSVPRATDTTPVADPEPEEPESLDERGRIVGWVTDSTGGGLSRTVFVTDPAGTLIATRSDADGWFELDTPEGAYEVYALGDAGIGADTSVATVQLHARAEVEVHLVAALDSRVDPGMVILETEDGFEVAWVLPGGTADTLGLQEGDRILSAGGVAALDLTADDLQDWLEQPGEPVQLELWFDDGDEGWVEALDFQPT